MKIKNTIEIRATASKVFYWLGDPSRAIEWMISVSRIKIIKKTPNWVGTTFRETVEEDGRGTEMRGVVVDFLGNERMAFHLEGKFNTVDVVWTLEEKEQSTQVSQVAEVRFKGLMRVMSVFFGPVFRKKAMTQAQQEFARLKELCERDS